jgi:flagellar basal-body rod protein FlgC
LDITSTLNISAAGMDAQNTRLQVIAENLANADTTGTTPGADPYQRQTVTFTDQMDQSTGMPLVTVSQIGTDPSPDPTKYDPGNPAANAAGYVKEPNVNEMVEIMDMQQAERSYSANLAVLQTSHTLLSRTLALLQP